MLFSHFCNELKFDIEDITGIILRKTPWCGAHVAHHEMCVISALGIEPCAEAMSLAHRGMV